MDLILSSGFLAFARHVGVLAAIEDAGVQVSGICGTSSGAIVGALWAAGYKARDIGIELSRAPAPRLRFHRAPWRGLLSMSGVIAHLRTLLPPTFDKLARPFAVGVCREGQHQLLDQGDLPAAVAASCAMPYVFAPVQVRDRVYCDGGVLDRLAFSAWQKWRPGEKAIIHWVERSHGRDVVADLHQHLVIRTPRARASFFNLGDFWGQADEAQGRAVAALGGPAPVGAKVPGVLESLGT